MKISPTSNIHLTYCTNIHAGESWPEVFKNLQQYLPSLKAKLSPNAPFGIGLRLAAIAGQELLSGDNLDRLRSWLQERDLYVFTLNGFPYGGFHRQVVKDRVYAPDWSQASRVDYTLQLAEILARLLPSELDGSISTVPLSYKPWWKTDSDRESILQACTLNLTSVALQLRYIREETGKWLHVDLEPEPDGGIENTEEAIAFFHNYLLPRGSAYLTRELGISRTSGEDLLRECIQICYDTCHFAVEYEEPELALSRLQEAGVGIGKVQLSTAVRVALSDDRKQRQAIAHRLSPFAESTYLHQTIERYDDGTLRHYRDLGEALPHLSETMAREWRIHFHVPIFLADYSLLQSTRDNLAATLDYLKRRSLCPTWEIETYTWEVLPPDLKLDILASIEREYRWVLDRFSSTQQ